GRVMRIDDPAGHVEPEVVAKLACEVDAVVAHLVAEMGHDELEVRELLQYGTPAKRHSISVAVGVRARGAVGQHAEPCLLATFVDGKHVRVVRVVATDARMHLDPLRPPCDATIEL